MPGIRQKSRLSCFCKKAVQGVKGGGKAGTRIHVVGCGESSVISFLDVGSRASVPILPMDLLVARSIFSLKGLWRAISFVQGSHRLYKIPGW